MKSWSTPVKILLFLTVLAAAVLFPSSLSKIQDKALLDKIETEPWENIKIADATELNVIDRLSMLYRYGKNDDIVRIDQNFYYKESEAEIASIALTEIIKMREMGAFPYIDLVKESRCEDFITETYLDTGKTAATFRVWNVMLSCGNYTIRILIDADTHSIYKYELWMEKKTKEALQLNLETVLDNFARYLEFSWDNIPIITSDNIVVRSAEGRGFIYQIICSPSSINLTFSQIVPTGTTLGIKELLK